LSIVSLMPRSVSTKLNSEECKTIGSMCSVCCLTRTFVNWFQKTPGVSVYDIKIAWRKVQAELEGDFDFDEISNALLRAISSRNRNIVQGMKQVYWEDVGGYDAIKRRVNTLLSEWLECFSALKRSSLCMGLLLHGPSGCGKTLIASAIASDQRFNFLTVNASAILSKYLGESEQNLRRLFERARSIAPCILFFDEIDLFGRSRDSEGLGSSAHQRILTTLLNELDGIQENRSVFLLAATNAMDRVDSALLRPGRIDTFIEVPPPQDVDQVSQVFQACLNGVSLEAGLELNQLSIDFVKSFVSRQALSNASIAYACRLAKMQALREESLMLKRSHFSF